MDISPWLCPQRQERGEKDVGSSSASACPQLRWPVFLLGSALPQALTSQELARTSFIVHVVPRTTQLLTTTTTATVPRPHSKTWPSLLLNSLCHNSVYVGPHKSQVLINLCLQRAKGDQVNQASTRQNPPDTWTTLCGQTYLVLVIYNRESEHGHHSWGEKEHTVIFLQIRRLQRRDLLRWQTCIMPLGQLIHQGSLY